MTIPLSKRVMLCFAWLLAASAGAIAILKYEHTAGVAGNTPRHWPAGTPVALDRSRNTLLMFAHPKCPCTRASIEELNRLMARCPENVFAHVLFFKPSPLPDDWGRTDLHQSAAVIPNVAIFEDVNGAWAKQFGAETSGYVLLYNPQGRLLFQGGITGSRGHAGDNASTDALMALLEGRDSGSRQTAVYGCSLLDQCSPEGTAP